MLEQFEEIIRQQEERLIAIEKKIGKK